MKITTPLLLLVLSAMSVPGQWVKQSVNTTASLRGLSVVGEKVIWASGTGGTYLKSADGGKTWKVGTIPGAEKLDFRDIEAFDANTAYVLSIGNGENSRIYKTLDGGETWKMQFINKNEKAFFDAIACWDKNNCIAMSDPVDGHYLLISTADGGNSWKQIVSNQMPAPKDGEAAFAASGTCLITHGKSGVFLVSGGSDARVFRSTDRGKTWSVANTPIVKGTPGSGIFSIAMFDSKRGIIVGGNYEDPDAELGTFARTSDGGKSWHAGDQWFGYRSSVAYVGKTIIVVGTSGSDSLRHDAEGFWRKEGSESLNSVAAKGRKAVWAVGPKGLVAKLRY